MGILYFLQSFIISSFGRPFMNKNKTPTKVVKTILLLRYKCSGAGASSEILVKHFKYLAFYK